MEVVSRLSPTNAFGPILPGQIADVAVHKGWAYLNSWDSPACERGGTYVVDIRNPAQPREAGFIPAVYPYYHGEGAHAITVNTPAFQGDILAVNNETYGSNVVIDTTECDNPPAHTDAGGFDLYDVSNPENPVPLVQAAGDTDTDQGPRAFPNSYHSVFIWQQGPRAFLVASDNEEAPDVDIFDITNPRAPVKVGDFDLLAMFPQIADGEEVNGGTVFHHDVVVKQIDGRWTMKVDYWDVGYVQLDVTDPSNPTLINDTTFAGEDPLMPGSGLFAEGNAHQGEFSFDNQFLLAADEDFGTHRLVSEITEAPWAGEPFAGVVSAAEPIPAGETISGDTVFVGYACTGTVPAPPPGVTIALAERGAPAAPPGACAGGFQEKIDAIEDAGYEMAVIFNNDFGAPGRCEGLINMLVDPATVDIPAVFVGRADAFKMLNHYDESTYQCTGAATPTAGDTQSPTPPHNGLTIEIGSVFDGWGYAHLYDAKTAEQIDAFAIPEAHDERYAFDFGDLTIHEFATDPTENLGYSAYYAGGMRVLSYDRTNGLSQVGSFIADEGSNFWGVEQFTTPQGERLIAGSDRDFGLYIFRYTGPGAAQPPTCADVTVMVPYKRSASVPLTCSDPNENPLRESTTSAPTGGSLSGNADSGSVTYTHTGNRLGPAGSFGFKANDGAADSNTATAELVAVARDGGRCFNPFVGSARRDVIVGSRFGDRISGARGRDTIQARAGRDCLSGGGGRDRLAGEAGNDRASGGGGADRVFGGGGRDRLLGNAGNDRLSGGDGNDRLTGGGGRNRYSGGGGADRISAKNGKVDRISCGAGRDRVSADRKDRVAGSCERVRR